jgi:hypothetical protein
MMIVLGYFLIAAAAVIAASVIIGFFLTNLLILLLQMMDRSIRLCRGKLPAFSAPHRLLRKLLSLFDLVVNLKTAKQIGLTTSKEKV